MADSVGGLKPQGISLHKQVDPKAMDAKLHEVAGMYEEQFLREMVKAMRGTVQESGLIKVSQGETIFREQLDQKNVENWSKQGGLGFQDIIYNQLKERLGAQLGITPPQARPQGPLPLNEKAQFTPQFEAGQQRLSARFSRDPAAAGAEAPTPMSLQAPYESELLGVKQINPEEYAIDLGHTDAVSEQPLRSQLVFRGVLSDEIRKASLGDKVAAGAPLGVLSPDAKSFFWNLQKSSEFGLKARNQSVSE